MKTILVVDDRPLNRELMKTILEYRGFEVIEAGDGEEALVLAKAHSPHLIISDVLMPRMDGFELARRVREDPAISNTPIMFSSAHYVRRESLALSRACGVDTILTKPCEPEVILAAVDGALKESSQGPSTPEPGEVFNFEHLQVLTNKLSEKNNDLRLANVRVAKLIETGQQMIQQREPSHLLRKYCEAALEIIGAEFASIGMVEHGSLAVEQFCAGTSNGEVTSSRISGPPPGGVICEILEQRASRRFTGAEPEAAILGLPLWAPPVFSFAGVPIASSSHVYGWMVLANKLGAAEFTRDEEQLLTLLAAQLGVTYENARLYDEANRRAEELEREMIERKRAEETLRESEARYRTLAETANDAIFIVGTDGAIQYINTEGARWFGMPASDVIGKSQHELFPATTADEHLDMCARVAATGEPVYDEAKVSFNNQLLWQSTWLAPIKDSGGAVGAIMGIARDVTERKRAAEAQAFLASIVESSDDAIVGKTPDGTIVSWNAGAVKIYGYSAEEMIGRNISILCPSDRADEIPGILEQLKRGDAIRHFQTVRVRKDGKIIDVSLSVSSVKDGEGNITAASTIARDVSVQKRAEDELLRAHNLALEASRIKTEFLNNISHELRTPMNGIIGLTELVLDSDLTGEQREELAMVRESAKSLMTLINNILTFSKADPSKLQSVEFSLEEHIHENVAVFAEQARRKGLELSFQISAEVPAYLTGDPDRLISTLRLLIDNAIKFTERGTVELRIDRESRSADEVCLHFSVRDTGIGIPIENQEMIFNPFTQVDGSLTRRYGGTGMGLTICRQMVEMTGDRIWVESEPGVGSVFHFTSRFHSVLKETLAPDPFDKFVRSYLETDENSVGVG